jgi:hypothetical protein
MSSLQHGGELPPHEHGAPPETYGMRALDRDSSVVARR